MSGVRVVSVLRIPQSAGIAGAFSLLPGLKTWRFFGDQVPGSVDVVKVEEHSGSKDVEGLGDVQLAVSEKVSSSSESVSGIHEAIIGGEEGGERSSNGINQGPPLFGQASTSYGVSPGSERFTRTNGAVLAVQQNAVGGAATMRTSPALQKDGIPAPWKKTSPVSAARSVGGSQKVIARISNAPKFMFKNDLLWFLKGCNLREENLVFIYDAKYRPKFIQLYFDSLESFRLAQRSLSMKGRFGGQYLMLTQDNGQLDDINRGLREFRGRSLLMMNVAHLTTTEDVERFFHGYRLDCGYPIKFFKFGTEASAASGRRGHVVVKPDADMQALVRFKTELEALRALREKQGDFCLENTVNLRFIE